MVSSRETRLKDATQSDTAGPTSLSAAAVPDGVRE